MRVDHTKASNAPVTTYLIIAHFLSMLNNQTRERLGKKFDVCYMYLMVKEDVAFAKHPALHEVEVHRGLNLGPNYNTPDSAKTFTSYIEQSLWQALLSTL